MTGGDHAWPLTGADILLGACQALIGGRALFSVQVRDGGSHGRRVPTPKSIDIAREEEVL